MILGFILLQGGNSSKEVGYGNQNETEICLKEQYFPKQCHEERTLALASQVATHIRNHKKCFRSATCCMHAQKEISHSSQGMKPLELVNTAGNIFTQSYPKSRPSTRKTQQNPGMLPAGLKTMLYFRMFCWENGLTKYLCSITTDT